MSVGLSEPQSLAAIAGIRLAGTSAGIYRQPRTDVFLMEIAPGSSAAAVFTRNRFSAAPVELAKAHLRGQAPRFCLVNSGNANAGTGAAGLADAQACCGHVAQLAGCDVEEVLPFSTGVIGQRLPVENICQAAGRCFDGLTADGWLECARAMMTTDTVAKGISDTLVLGGTELTITGIAKGSGMIRPDMATMLAFVATDAAVDPALLQQWLQAGMEKSFNRITVDGDTSTNDACLLIATGKSGVQIQADTPDCGKFRDSLDKVLGFLARAIVRDGEGASKFVTIRVEQGVDRQECLKVAYAIAHSPLVKTAVFASDPNWGRILAAVGRAGIDDLDVSAVEIYLDDVCIVEQGGISASYTEAQGQSVMAGDEILIRVVLNRGVAGELVWTSDLSYDYVRINAEYRT